MGSSTELKVRVEIDDPVAPGLLFPILPHGVDWKSKLAEAPGAGMWLVIHTEKFPSTALGPLTVSYTGGVPSGAGVANYFKLVWEYSSED